MRFFDALIDVLTELLFDPELGKDREVEDAPLKPQPRYDQKGRRIQTAAELEAERVAFRKSLARTDY